MERRQYSLYKGLQRPLVFKIFKGKFIYWAIGSILSGIIVGGLIAALISSTLGILTMIGVAFPLLMFTINKQKKGLYDKNKSKGVFIFTPHCHIKNYGNQTGV